MLGVPKGWCEYCTSGHSGHDPSAFSLQTSLGLWWELHGCRASERPLDSSEKADQHAERRHPHDPPAQFQSANRCTILVTSLDGTHFSEVCETLVVNAHGCAMLTRVKLDSGVPLHFHSKDGRETTAQVVTCQPIGSDYRSWRLGAKLDRPRKFLGLEGLS